MCRVAGCISLCQMLKSLLVAGPRQGPPQRRDKVPKITVTKEFQEIKKDKETVNILKDREA